MPYGKASLDTIETSGNLTVTGNVITTNVTATGNVTISGQGTVRPMVLGTAQASTSGTEIIFNDIPSWVEKVIVLFDSVSLSGTDQILIQLGTSAAFLTSGYTSASAGISSTSTVGSATDGFVVRGAVAAASITGTITIANITNNVFVSSHSINRGDGAVVLGAGRVDLGGTLTRIKVTRSGTNTFDAGTINIIYA